jgi:transketolase
MKFKNNIDLKKRLLELCYKNKLHHLGSYFSSLNIIDEIYSKMEDKDVFILSNGHAVAALYVVLEKYYNFDSQELLEKYGEHPKKSDEHKIYCSTGSLGLGILVAVGAALANKDKNIYCLISDGEAAEGCVWEALRYAKEKRLTNLKIYVNANGYCAYDTVDLDYLEKRISAFNNDVIFCRTTVEHFDFLKGIDAHYYCMSDKDYEENK